MINPVVDPMPPTNHRVVTTVLYDATMPQEVMQYNQEKVTPVNHQRGWELAA